MAILDLVKDVYRWEGAISNALGGLCDRCEACIPSMVMAGRNSQVDSSKA